MVRRSAYLLTVLAGLLSPVSAAEVTGVPRILDADTIAAGADKIRLSGVDAPESDHGLRAASGAIKPGAQNGYFGSRLGD